MQISPYLSLAHFPMLLTLTILISGDSNGQAVSPFHDIPLFANAEVGIYVVHLTITVNLQINARDTYFKFSRIQGALIQRGALI